MANDPPPPSPPAPPADAPAPAPASAPVPAPTPAPVAAEVPASAPASIPDAPIPSVSAAPTPAPSAAPPTPSPPPSVASHAPPTSTSTPPLAPIIAAPVAATAHHYGPPPIVHHLSAPPAPYRPSTLPQQLKRLAYVVSIVLGGGAVLAGVWSAFLLPLLHATFSARAALVAPQRERWRGIVDTLKAIRLNAIFPEPRPKTKEDSEVVEIGPGALVRARTRESKASERSEAGDKDQDKDKALAKIDKSAPGSPRSATIHTEGEDEKEAEPGPARLFGDVSPLSSALRDLASSLDATATTRTSLVSTLEGYTSGLHRELFITRGGGGLHNTPYGSAGARNSVGLGTLGANLAKAGGPETSPLGLPAAKSEEWDNVRREVRAIKGLLLNRRNFSLPARTASAV